VGLDHASWSVLAHMFPLADIPVLELSVNMTKPAEYHYRLGRELAPA
jgi:4,5-DOPA dioxygenase extradiol